MIKTFQLFLFSSLIALFPYPAWPQDLSPSTPSQVQDPRLAEAEKLSLEGAELAKQRLYHEAELRARTVCSLLEEALGPDHPELAVAVTNLGVYLSRQGKLDEARLLYEQAIRIREVTFGGNHPMVAKSLLNLAQLFKDKGDIPKAITLHERVLSIRETALGRDDVSVGEVAFDLGQLLAAGERLEEAQAWLERALQIQEKALGAEHPSVVLTMAMLGKLIDRRGNHRHAQNLYEQSLSILERTSRSDDFLAGVVANNLAGVLLDEGDYAGARPLYERALRVIEKTLGPDHLMVASTLEGLGQVLEQQAEYATARELVERGLDIRKRQYGTSHLSIAMSLDHLGRIHHREGNPVRARALLEEGLRIREVELGPEDGAVAVSLNNLGVLLEVQGDYEAAQGYQERALRIRERVFPPSHPTIATSYLNLGRTLAKRGNYALAKVYLERAIGLDEKNIGNTHPDLAFGLRAYAQLLYDRAEYVAAYSAYQRSLQILEGRLGSEHKEVGIGLNEMALTLLAQGDLKEATVLLQKAHGILLKAYGEEHPYLSAVRINLGLVSWAIGDLAGAKEHILAGNRFFAQGLPGQLSAMSLAEQLAWIEQEIPIRTSLLLSVFEAERDIHEAYGSILQVKGLLLETLHRQGEMLRRGKQAGYTPEVEQLQRVRARLVALHHKADGFPGEHLKRQMETLTKEKEGLERMLMKALPATERLDVLENEDVLSFSRHLNKSEVFIDCYHYKRLTKDGSKATWHYAAIVTKRDRGPQFVDLGPAESIESAILAWRQAVEDSKDATTQLSQLATLLWRSLGTALSPGTQQIWVSPDLDLNRIPWQALAAVYQKTATINVSQISSPRAWVKLRMNPIAPRFEEKPSVFLAGGIDFNAGEKQVGSTPERFPFLAGTDQEIRGLATLAADEHFPVTLLRGAEATETSVKDNLGKSTYVHLATHGFFVAEEIRPESLEVTSLRGAMLIDPDRPKPIGGNGKATGRHPLVESGIALAGANVTDPANSDASGILTAEELVGLDLSHTNLITLSACETGRGQERTGQGVLGLQASLMAAGARSLLMSLWKVPDESTSLLMQAFYKNLWEKKLTKAESLKQAQATVRDDSSGRFTAHIHWAGWVLVGEAW